MRSRQLRTIVHCSFRPPGWVFARSRRRSLGATSGTRWRTRPCRGAAHSAPFPSFFLGLWPSCEPCERRKGRPEHSPVCRWPLAGRRARSSLTLGRWVAESRGFCLLVSSPPLRSLPACSDIFTGTREDAMRRRGSRYTSCSLLSLGRRHFGQVAAQLTVGAERQG